MMKHILVYWDRKDNMLHISDGNTMDIAHGVPEKGGLKAAAKRLNDLGRDGYIVVAMAATDDVVMWTMVPRPH